MVDSGDVATARNPGRLGGPPSAILYADDPHTPMNDPDTTLATNRRYTPRSMVVDLSLSANTALAAAAVCFRGNELAREKGNGRNGSRERSFIPRGPGLEIGGGRSRSRSWQRYPRFRCEGEERADVRAPQHSVHARPQNLRVIVSPPDPCASETSPTCPSTRDVCPTGPTGYWPTAQLRKRCFHLGRAKGEQLWAELEFRAHVRFPYFLFFFFYILFCFPFEFEIQNSNLLSGSIILHILLLPLFIIFILYIHFLFFLHF
jgi:hypothetical protein